MAAKGKEAFHKAAPAGPSSTTQRPWYTPSLGAAGGGGWGGVIGAASRRLESGSAIACVRARLWAAGVSHNVRHAEDRRTGAWGGKGERRKGGKRREQKVFHTGYRGNDKEMGEDQRNLHPDQQGVVGGYVRVVRGGVERGQTSGRAGERRDACD